MQSRLSIKKTGPYILWYLIVGAGAVLMLLPFWWMLISACRPEHQIFSRTISLVPAQITFEHFKTAWIEADFGQYFLNSTLVACIQTIASVICASMAAFAFARLSFEGDRILFVLLLSTLMIPGQVTLIPLFLLLKHIPLAGGNNIYGMGGIGWLDSYWGLIVPGFLDVGSIFLLRQFFLSIPKDIDDAALIDGCSDFQIYSQIILPLSKPALLTVALFRFQDSWNAFLWPLIIVNRDSMRTLQVGLTAFQQEHTIQIAPLMAGTVITVMPIIILFLFTQRYFVQGIAQTGIKS